MLEQSLGEQLPRRESPVEHEGEIKKFQAWVEEFATPLYTEIDKTDRPLTIQSPLFLKLRESLNGREPDIYSLLIERISFILRSGTKSTDQLTYLSNLLNKERLFHSPQGVREFLLQQPH